MHMHLPRFQKGNILLFILMFGGFAFTIIVGGVASYAMFEHQASQKVHYRESALHIAEAGIDYYRWHLAHDPTDFTDSTGEAGPYVRPFTDKDGTTIGYFSLEIDEPLPGSTVSTIRSTGWHLQAPNSTRTIQVRVGFPAFTEYTFLSNASMNFGFTTVVSGVVHSNGGIRFDGTSDSWVQSARDRYQYGNQTHNGVWGGGGPRSFWRYPVPAIDFDSVTADLAAVKSNAEDAGVYLSSSGQEGWHLVFSGSSFDVYRVTNRDCYYGEGRWRNRGWRGWYWDGSIYCYDIGSETYEATYSIPANGSIFVEDDVWVDGEVDGRVTIAAGAFPVLEPYHDIIIPNNLTYHERGSDDVTGLLAQGNIIVPFEAPDTLTIEAALLSQFKTNQRPYYYDDTRTELTIFGSQISRESGGWKYVNGWGHVTSGYINTNHIYDGNLKYYPPPGFPVGDTYDLISWEELES